MFIIYTTSFDKKKIHKNNLEDLEIFIDKCRSHFATEDKADLRNPLEPSHQATTSDTFWNQLIKKTVYF